VETALEEIAPSAPLEQKQKILSLVQILDPPGIGARNLQECLLLQLKLKKREQTLAAKIIAEHFDDLIHNRLPYISKELHLSMSALTQIIEKEIAPLDLNPGYRYFHQPTTAIVPDLLLLCIEGKWQIEVNSSPLPRIQIAPIYVDVLQNGGLENEESSYLRRQLSGGRWLKRIVQRRNATLRRIGEFLLKNQIEFFQGDQASLRPMGIQEAAAQLGLHESTVARAAANKFIGCPQGLFALKSFFSQAVKTTNGKTISKHNLRKMLLRAIEKEDKQKPLSDEEIAGHLSQLGVCCARRTVAKYRTAMKIAPAAKRRKWAL